MDKGLYGFFVVEELKDDYDWDYIFMLDEWMSFGDMSMGDLDSMDMKDMNYNEMNMFDLDKNMDEDMLNMGGYDMSMYDLYMVNGKLGVVIEKLIVKEGDKVRICLINVGFISY